MAKRPSKAQSKVTSGDAPTRARAEHWHKTFLEALAAGLTIKAAAAESGVTRKTAYEHRGRDELFAAAWDDARDDGTDLLETEAWRRAVDGWVERGIYDDDGALIGEVRKFSDAMLALLLKSRRPGVYRERHTVEHTGSVEQRVKLDLSRLSDEQLAALEAIQPDAGSAEQD